MCELPMIVAIAKRSTPAMACVSVVVVLCRKWNGEEHLLANVPLRRYKLLTSSGAGSHGNNDSDTVTTSQS